MKIAALVARWLLGLLFTVFGLNGFLHFIPAQMPSGLAGEFVGAVFASHYAYLIFGVQLVGGVLLLLNQFVPLALVLLGPVIVNILAFHLTMLPEGLTPGILATVLWVVVAYRIRNVFAQLLTRNPEPGN